MHVVQVYVCIIHVLGYNESVKMSYGYVDMCDFLMSELQSSRCGAEDDQIKKIRIKKALIFQGFFHGRSGARTREP